MAVEQEVNPEQEARLKAAEKGLQEFCAKFEVMLVPVIQYMDIGIRPALQIKDVKKQPQVVQP